MEEKLDIELVDCKVADLKKMKCLEQMWPEVQKLITQGVKHRVIHAKLNEMGLAISMRTYKNKLHRIRVKKKIVTSKEKSLIQKVKQSGGQNPTIPNDGIKRFKHNVSAPTSDW